MTLDYSTFHNSKPKARDMCDMTEDDFEVPIKGVIVGNGAVGKSSMIQVGLADPALLL